VHGFTRGNLEICFCLALCHWGARRLISSLLSLGVAAGLASVGHAQLAKTWTGFYTGLPYTYGQYSDVDRSGNVVVAGITQPGLFSGADTDWFITYYNPAGTRLWAKTYNGPGDGLDFVQNVEFDGMGNLVVVGAEIYNQAGDQRSLARKYDKAGGLIWNRTFKGNQSNGGFFADLEFDSANNVYMTGDANYAGRSGDALLVKYAPTGQQLFYKVWTSGNNNKYESGRRIDLNGDSGYILGYRENSDIGLYKFNPDTGAWEGTNRYAAPTGDRPVDMAFSGGSVVVAGDLDGASTDGCGILLQYNENLQLQKGVRIGALNDGLRTNLIGVETDFTGNSYVGYTTTKYPEQTSNVFAAGYDRWFIRSWAKKILATKPAFFGDLEIDTENNLLCSYYTRKQGESDQAYLCPVTTSGTVGTPISIGPGYSREVQTWLGGAVYNCDNTTPDGYTAQTTAVKWKIKLFREVLDDGKKVHVSAQRPDTTEEYTVEISKALDKDLTVTFVQDTGKFAELIDPKTIVIKKGTTSTKIKVKIRKEALTGAEDAKKVEVTLTSSEGNSKRTIDVSKVAP